MKTFMINLSLAFALLAFYGNPEMVYAGQHQQDPSYAKWGRLAMKQAAQRYNVEILDYEHIGRQSISSNITQETFKLWVRDKTDQEFGIFVYIQFETDTEKLRSIRFKETTN